MAKQSSAGLRLPKYHRTKDQRHWVASERRTARLIRTLWKAAGQKRRSDSAFLWLLTQCAWTNKVRDKGRESTRQWRNEALAAYIGVNYDSDERLAQDLALSFKTVSAGKWLSWLKQYTGIAHYYTAFRPATEAFVMKHSKSIALAFQKISRTSSDPIEKVGMVARIVADLGQFEAAGRDISLYNGLTPVLSCLDPQCRFPIMNGPTAKLLRHIGSEADAEGAADLSRFIGMHDYGVKDARELDVYVCSQKFPPSGKQTRKNGSKNPFKDVGIRSEINSIAKIAAKKTTITKAHNKLTNRLRSYLLWRQKVAKESRFDMVVLGWKKNRDLLIEAKTASSGPSGRSQIRQAIGQLYDYRFTHMPNKEVDLAVLLAKAPGDDVKKLLKSLEIELLWFKGKNLEGTVKL
jgi:hypothetical protein